MRSPEIANSRHRMQSRSTIATISCPRKFALSLTSAIISPSTITLSITASMKRPKSDTIPRSRAILPSSQSVSAAAMNSQNAALFAHGASEYISPTTANISGTRERVRILGKFIRARDARKHAGVARNASAEQIRRTFKGSLAAAMAPPERRPSAPTIRTARRAGRLAWAG